MEAQKEAIDHSNRWRFAVYIGLWAGIIWGAVWIMEHFFRFTSLPPGFLVEPFYKRSFLLTWQGYLVGWTYFILFSIFASLLYMMLFPKTSGPWAGVGYGAVWWGLIFLLIGPPAGMMNWIAYLDWNTIICSVCLFLVWGLFIGYSIALEFTDERTREPFEQGARGPQTG